MINDKYHFPNRWTYTIIIHTTQAVFCSSKIRINILDEPWPFIIQSSTCGVSMSFTIHKSKLKSKLTPTPLRIIGYLR